MSQGLGHGQVGQAQLGQGLGLGIALSDDVADDDQVGGGGRLAVAYPFITEIPWSERKSDMGG